MSQHVCIPIDGSEHSFAGLEYCFASFSDASLTAVCVVDPAFDHHASVGESDPPERQCERALERATELAAEHGRTLQTEIRIGTPHSEILSVVADDEIDHVVMGSHGQSPITRPFLGRVSEAIVRRSPVSTTIVPESNAAIRERDLPGRILVPVDGSEQAEAALAYALETVSDGSPTLLHVIDLPFDRSRVDVEGTYLDKIRTAHERSAAEILDDATAVAESRDVAVETATAYGSPAQTIVDYADEHGYDQIVMGSHGRSLAARLLTGSVAERVTRRSTRTVTLVRGDVSTK